MWSAHRKLYDAAQNPNAEVRTSIRESLDAAQDLVAQIENTLQDASRSMNGMGG